MTRPLRPLTRFAVPMLAVVTACGLAWGQASSDAARRESRLVQLESEVQRLADERERLAASEKGVLGKLERLSAEARLRDAELEELTLLGQQAASRLAQTEQELWRTEQRLTELREELQRTVLMLHRLGPLGRFRFLLDAADSRRLSAGLRLLDQLSSLQQEDVKTIRADRERLEQLEKVTLEQRAELEIVAQRTVAARKQLQSSIEAREALLNDVRHKRWMRDEAIAELDAARAQLEEQITHGGSGAPITLDVAQFRGLLSPPVEGPVEVPFGNQKDERFGTEIPHPGWDIQASFGEPVRAVFDGNVVWTGWLRGYGMVVVVDHGKGVHTVMAHLSAIVVERGQQVYRDELLGRVGDTGSLKGPFLYFEVREQGKAVDPSVWVRTAT